MGRLIQFCTEESLYNGPFEWQAAGMGYIIVTDNGKLICIDGGGTRKDGEGMISLLEKNTVGKPAVDLWILTHPHNDHFEALWNIAIDEDLRERIDVRCLAYSIPESMPWVSKGGTADSASDLAKVNSLASLLKAKVCRLYKNMDLHIDNVTFHCLHTYENLSVITDPNEYSSVFMLKGSQKSAMFTGDAYESCLQTIIADPECPDLKCDILQVAHHALNGGSTEFYKQVNAKTVLVPTSESGNRAMMNAGEYHKHNAFAIAQAQTIIKAFTGTASIEF